MKKKLGFLFGDFDPVYTEQLQMCSEIVDEFALDGAMLAPYCIPRRTESQLTTYIDSRKDMIKLATWRNKNIRLLEEFPVKDSSLSSQIEVLDSYEAKYNAEIYYITTSNHLTSLMKSAGFPDFVKSRRIIVAVRPHFTGGLNDIITALKDTYGADIQLSATTKTVLSSTVIRAYIQMSVINENHVPLNVLEYINKNILYKQHSRLFEKVRVIQPAPIYAHTVATCLNCIELARLMNLNHNAALLAGLLHNIGKCYTVERLEVAGVYVPQSYKHTDIMSMHGYLGELAAKYFMGITDPDILSAIKYHSTAKANMSPFCLMLFAASTLANEHTSDNYENIRRSFFENPRAVFFEMIDHKYHSARRELPLFGFPRNLRAAHYYYSQKKNLNITFTEFSPADD